MKIAKIDDFNVNINMKKNKEDISIFTSIYKQQLIKKIKNLT